MKHLKIYTNSEIHSLISKREGETKFGEKIQYLQSEENPEEALKNTRADFVLLGISEDIGVRANFGKAGTATTFEQFLPTLLNTQNHKLNKGKRLFLLGCLQFPELMREAQQLSADNPKQLTELRKLVGKIDKEVSYWVRLICENGKIPIVVGGGHNNAYGMIKGCALARQKSISCINIDAHTDYRTLEGRHSGNGFSYALEEGFLNRYSIFGIHENYTSKSIFKTFEKEVDRLRMTTYEDIAIRSQKDSLQEFDRALEFVKREEFGLELDMDSIQGVPASAMTPSGFSVDEVRRFVHWAGKEKNNQYLHICEAQMSTYYPTAKLISYLVTDFMRSKGKK